MKNPNGFGGVINLGSNRRKPYAVRITQGYRRDGTAIRKYIGYYETRREAMIALSEYHLNPQAIRKIPTLQDLYEIFMQDIRNKRSENTYRMYVSTWQYVERYARYEITDIKKSHVQDVINDLADSGKSYSLCNKVKILMSQIFQLAMDDDYITKNYAKNIILPEPDEIDKSIFTPDEIKRLFKAVDSDFNATLPLILIYTCMRPSELLEIRKFNIYLDKGYMIGGLKTKAGKNRIIPINSKILPYIKEWMDSKSEFLIHRDNVQMTYSYFNKSIYYKMLELAGVRALSPHKCRKTGLSMLKKAKVDTTYIKLIAGHATQDVTDNYYISVSPETLVDAVQVI